MALDPVVDPNVGNGLFLVNPLLLANAEYQKKTTDAYNVTANASYNITKNLTFRSIFGYDQNDFINRVYSDSVTPLSIRAGGQKPIAELDTINTKTLTNSNVLTYSVKGFKGKHDFDFLVGEETYDLRTETRNDLFQNYPNFTSYTDAFKQTGLGVPSPSYPKFRQTRYTSLSFFSRVNYSFLDRYLFSFNIRADAASKFISGKQWGYFPAGSFAWRVKKEKFLEDVKFISDLKFRAGFGTVGNDRIADYLFVPTFNNSSFYYGINNQLVTAYTSTSLVNQDLQWESTINRNYGVDISLFNNRIDLSFDVYNNSSNHLLLNVPIASTYGYSTQIQNVGATSNKGVELQLNAIILKKSNNNSFSWTANFNISTNKNKVVALGPNQQSFFPAASWGVSGQPADYIIRIGDPVGSIYGLVTDGFYKVSDFNYNTATSVYTLKSGVPTNVGIIGPVQPGSIKFKDLNGDGVIDLDHDRTIIGNPNAKFTGGLNQQFTYKQWDVSVFVNFSVGNDIYNANKIEFTNGYTNNANMLAIMEGRWKVVTATGQTAQFVNSANQVVGIAPDQLAALNANATIWQPLKSTGAFYPSSWAIEDGSFLRLNNVTIGYSLPVKNLVGLKMSKLRFYVTSNNLAVFTNYSGYDPEVSVRNSPLTPGLDYSAYPKSRSFIFGINATF
jgi:TonB-linked SusC/RagA family outer membrane protein